MCKRPWLISLANVKEHATLSAGARVDHGVDVEATKEDVNWAADRGCVSRLVRLLGFKTKVRQNVERELRTHEH
jgi:hypothetical protein